MKEHRGWLKYWFFTIITLGIYSLFWWRRLVIDVNKATSDEKGNHQIRFLWAVLFGLITFGIVLFIWQIKLMCRVYGKANRENLDVRGSIAFFLISQLLLAWTIIFPIIAFAKFCKTMNHLAVWYNQKHPE